MRVNFRVSTAHPRTVCDTRSVKPPAYRISKLRQCDLDPFEVEILSLLERPVAFTPVELGYLAQIEQGHGIGES